LPWLAVGIISEKLTLELAPVSNETSWPFPEKSMTVDEAGETLKLG